MALPKPPAGPTAGKTAGMAGLYGGLGPTGYINQQYAPIAAQLAQQQQARVSTLNSLIQSILANLHQPQPDVYGAAAQDQTAAANAAAATLQRVNPNAATQSMLQAIGAPGSQQAQVGQQNANTFTGGAALDQYVGGALPAGVFAQDQAARGTYLNSLPALVGLAATQGVGRLGLLASQENANLASQKASAQQNAIATLADYTVKNQSNKITQASVLGDLLGYIPKGALGNKQPIGTLAGKRVTIEGQNANTSATRAANAQANADRNYALAVKQANRVDQPKANASLSKSLGYVVDNAGNPLLGANGKRIPIPKSATTAKGPLGLSSKDYQKFTSLALGAARNYHGAWTDKTGAAQTPLSWQQYLTHGEEAGIPVAILIAQGKKVYSPQERKLGLIPGQGKRP